MDRSGTELVVMVNSNGSEWAGGSSPDREPSDRYASVR